MKELIERIEGAEGPGRGPILDAFYYIHPQLYSNQTGYSDWFYTHEAFVQKLDAGAYLDAAMSLVPEGWKCGFEMPGLFDGVEKSEAWVWPWESSFDPDWRDGNEGYRSNPDGHRTAAATPALALCAAALRAIGDTHDD